MSHRGFCFLIPQRRSLQLTEGEYLSIKGNCDTWDMREEWCLSVGVRVCTCTFRDYPLYFLGQFLTGLELATQV